ncbi:gephyrin-like molybdotransferase Glp [Flavobacterium sp.]|uniref:molybdopterin molybdotransferase MoeA n=1 Tax=Flavobacterium sp. TaxID=239 RepID=UPI00286A0F0A|nr:gephyrin-like molybdotransferase Glp [Flavobacterium sp.]
MISIDEAFSKLDGVDFPLKETAVSLMNASHCVLSETVLSPINMPPFRQSNMDGFALSLHEALVYEIVGEVKAGDSKSIDLKPGQAVKIFTGAAIPNSAQAVIQIEKVSTKDNQLFLQETVLHETNIRPLGSQIQQNDIALEKGTFLNPAAIGFLAGLGFTSVNVYQKPTVAIITTGNELVAAGQPLAHGQVYESNGIMLQTALHNSHFNQVKMYQMSDDFENTKSTLKQAIDDNDIVVVSGGISVGDYDFVYHALQSLNVETLFYKVNQKPGKPLLVGKLNDKMIFALPGNPAASLTCFYIYVLPTLQKFSGMKTSYKTTIQKNLANDYAVDNTRDQFLKATISNDEVTILSHQDSSMLDSFALANALVYLKNGDYTMLKGDKVAVYLL